MGWLKDLIKRNGNLQPIKDVSRETGVSVGALRKAAQQGRLRAEKRGHFWFASPKDVERAQAAGKIRRG